MRHKTHYGFGLVDLVIVVIILGVVAAISVPRMSRARDADSFASHDRLTELRQAIVAYAADHDGVYPGATDGTAGTFISQLTLFTNAAGDVSATRDTAFPYGPYLTEGIPPAPFGAHKHSTAVWIDTIHSPPIIDETIGAGWLYNPHTGEIVINARPPFVVEKIHEITE